MANVVGIDITESTVRAAQLRVSGRKVEPLRYLEVSIPQLGAEGSRATALAGAVRELLETLGDRPDAVHVALEGQLVSLRTVNIPAAAAKRVADILPFELDSQLPFPVEEAIIDHQPVATREGQLVLLTAAARRSAISSTLETLNAAGLDPRELPPGGVCLDALLPLPEPDTETGVELVVHIEDAQTDMCIMRDGHCELARTLDCGLQTAQEAPTTLRTALVQTVSMYRAQGGPALSGVWVSGTGGDQASFVEWLGNLLQLPTRAVPVPAPQPGVEVSPVFGKAYSLAARTARRQKRLNLRRGPFEVASKNEFLRQQVRLLAACAAAIVCAYTFSVWAEYVVLTEERDTLGEQLHELTTRKLGEGTRSVRRARELLEALDKTDDPMPEFDALQTLGAVSDAIDDDIKHSTRKLEIQLDDGGGDGTFELQGSVPDLASRDQVASALESHECIRELEKGRISSLPGRSEKTYSLEGAIGCSAPKKKKRKKRSGG